MSVPDTKAGGPQWPLPWHVDGFDDEWFVLADNDWPVCQCETEEAANALALLRTQKEKLVEALKVALTFYDGLDRSHDDGEAKVLDDLASALREAGQ